MLTARFSVRPSAFALAHALAAVPEVTIEADKTAAHSTAFVMPSLWATGGDLDAFESALSSDPTVDAVVTAEPFGEYRFFHLRWADAVNERVDTIIDHEGTILDARVREQNWVLRIRFVDRSQFDAFREKVVERTGAYDLLDLTATKGPHTAESDLTPAQRDALVAAVDRGYFDIPRDATVAEVAGDLGVSEQAASERLRRGVQNLVTGVLVTGE